MFTSELKSSFHDKGNNYLSPGDISFQYFPLLIALSVFRSLFIWRWVQVHCGAGREN